MPRYEILDDAGNRINTIVVAESEVAGFVPAGGGAVLISALNKPLALLKEAARRELATSVQGERLKLMPDLPGQDLVYFHKLDEARRIVADPNPKAKDYPLLAREIGRTAQSLADVAQAVQAKSAEWKEGIGAIEAYRMELTARIEAASETDIEALVRTDHRAALAAVRTSTQTENVAQTTAEVPGAVGTPST